MCLLGLRLGSKVLRGLREVLLRDLRGQLLSGLAGILLLLQMLMVLLLMHYLTVHGCGIVRHMHRGVKNLSGVVLLLLLLLVLVLWQSLMWMEVLWDRYEMLLKTFLNLNVCERLLHVLLMLPNEISMPTATVVCSHCHLHRS